MTVVIDDLLSPQNNHWKIQNGIQKEDVFRGIQEIPVTEDIDHRSGQDRIIVLSFSILA